MNHNTMSDDSEVESDEETFAMPKEGFSAINSCIKSLYVDRYFEVDDSFQRYHRKTIGSEWSNQLRKEGASMDDLFQFVLNGVRSSLSSTSSE
jgi:hypothetical protein